MSYVDAKIFERKRLQCPMKDAVVGRRQNTESYTTEFQTVCWFMSPGESTCIFCSL